MDKIKKNMEPLKLENHARPYTRREFIAQGFLAGAGLLSLPTLGQFLLSQSAHAATSTPLKTPFLVFDLAGGAAMAANFLVGKKGGPQDLLSNYDQLGWNPKQTAIDTRFGLPMADASVSKMMQGMLSVMSADAQTKFRMASLLHSALIDTSQNPLSALSLVMSAGTVGSKLPKGLGSRFSLSGGNSRAALEAEQYRPIVINKIEDLTSTIGLSSVFAEMPDTAKVKLAETARKLSSRQLSKVLTGTAGTDVLAAVDKNYQSYTANVGLFSGLDPRSSTDFSQIYGVNAQTASSATNLVRAGVVHAALKGMTGPAAITIDGCDYHNGTQATGDAKDLEIGIEIGRAVEAAHRLKVPLFIQIITDGGIYPRTGTRIWAGDSNETCMSVIGYYNPNGATKYINGIMQIGSYTDGQGADRSTLIGDSPLLAAYAAFANYLQIEKRAGDFDDYVNGVFSNSQLDSVLSFEG